MWRHVTNTELQTITNFVLSQPSALVWTCSQPVLQLNLTLQMLPSGCTMQHNTPGNTASFYTGCLQKSSGNSHWSNSRAAIWSHLCCLFARNAAFPHHWEHTCATIPLHQPGRTWAPEWQTGTFAPALVSRVLQGGQWPLAEGRDATTPSWSVSCCWAWHIHLSWPLVSLSPVCKQGWLPCHCSALGGCYPEAFPEDNLLGCSSVSHNGFWAVSQGIPMRLTLLWMDAGTNSMED